MRKLFFLLLIFQSVICFAQQDTLVYYINEKNERVDNKLNAKYERRVVQKDSLFIVNDYYVDGGIQMTGFFLNDSLNVKYDRFVYYYKNGKVSSVYYYNKNGDKDGDYEKYYNNGSIKIKGGYKNDEQIGEWRWYFKNGQESSIEEYENGELLSYQFFQENGTQIEGEYEQMPYFIGGEANLLKFIQTNLHFPKKMAKKKIEGLVLVQFKIDIDGSVQNPQIMKSTHPLFAIEAMKVIKKIPNFTPGKQHNLPVQVYYKVPIYFMYE